MPHKRLPPLSESHVRCKSSPADSLERQAHVGVARFGALGSSPVSGSCGNISRVHRSAKNVKHDDSREQTGTHGGGEAVQTWTVCPVNDVQVPTLGKRSSNLRPPPSDSRERPAHAGIAQRWSDCFVSNWCGFESCFQPQRRTQRGQGQRLGRKSWCTRT